MGCGLVRLIDHFGEVSFAGRFLDGHELLGVAVGGLGRLWGRRVPHVEVQAPRHMMVMVPFSLLSFGRHSYLLLNRGVFILA